MFETDAKKDAAVARVGRAAHSRTVEGLDSQLKNPGRENLLEEEEKRRFHEALGTLLTWKLNFFVDV